MKIYADPKSLSEDPSAVKLPFGKKYPSHPRVGEMFYHANNGVSIWNGTCWDVAQMNQTVRVLTWSGNVQPIIEINAPVEVEHILMYDGSRWINRPVASTYNHRHLKGLDADDHPQYLTKAKADNHYAQSGQVNIEVSHNTVTIAQPKTQVLVIKPQSTDTHQVTLPTEDGQPRRVLTIKNGGKNAGSVRIVTQNSTVIDRDDYITLEQFGSVTLLWDGEQWGKL